jgi:septum formation protein
MSAPVSIVLASSSPRRRQLLALLGLAFTVCAAEVDESPQDGEDPAGLARRLSLAKAEALAPRVRGLLIAADTLVVVEGQVLGKPADAAEARTMLRRLRNRWHAVYTGLTLWDVHNHRLCTQVATTPVLMRNYTDVEMERYIASGDPLDKAGAYAIQHAELNPVARVEGCAANVMGLPLCHLYRVLRDWGIVVPVHPLASCPWAVETGCPWSAEIITGAPERWCLEGEGAC